MPLCVQSLRTLRYVNAPKLRYILELRFKRGHGEVLCEAQVNLCGPENIDHASIST